jgi:uncharacterized protein (DUF58 family)
MKPGRTLVILLLLVGLIGTLVNGGVVYSRMLYMGLLLISMAWLWAQASLLWIRMERRARSLRARVGDIFEERYELFNNGRVPSLWVEISNETTMPGASGSRVLTMLIGRQKRSYVARTWLAQRGGFPLGPTILKSGDPFGLFQVRKRFDARESLIVLPMMFDISTFPSPPGLLPGGPVIQRKSLDVTPHAAGVREYTTGDTLKRIHWPTTARRGKLMVKEFEQDPQAEVWLFLDAERRAQAQLHYEPPETHVDALFFGKRPKFTLPPSTLEYSISITASLAHYFIAQKRAVGLVTAGRAYTVILAERSVRQESKILETLAFLEGDGRLSLAAVITAQAQQLPLGSSVILVTPSASNELLIAIDDLQRRNLHPVVVLLNSESFGVYKDHRPLVHSLSERSIPVCQINCGADLSKALSIFASSDTSKDLLSWLKAPSKQSI